MFSVGYYNSAMVINAIKMRRISFKNIEELRRLVIQVLRSSNRKIVIDINGVNFIDSASFEIINNLHGLASRQGVEMAFTNVDSEVKELFELIPEAANYNVIDFEYQPSTVEEEVLV